MGKWKHRLSDIDPEARTAICAHCGSVAIRSCGPGRWRCANGKREQRGERPPRSRAWLLRHKRAVPITPEEYDKLHETQQGKCAICQEPASDFHIDHCHTTNKIRGLLCPNCNVGLGRFKDNPVLLQAAITYLQ